VHVGSVLEMATPKRNEIIERARELWHEDTARRGDPSFDIEPELEELREEGFLTLAQSELMRDRHKAQIESHYIDFPQDFDVDVKEVFESNALILGSRHTGKSDVAMLICDRAMKEGAIIVVFDPSLDWIRRSSIADYMKVDRVRSLEVPNNSMIYDISLLSPMQQAKMVEAFSKRLFEAQAKALERKQYLVIFEEAHTYFPQGCMRAKRLQNTVRLLSVGRNIDIACVLISQFASMIDKFAVKHSMSQAWFGFTKEPNDTAYLKQILGEDIEYIKKLEDGQFVYLTREKASKIGIKSYQSDVAKTEVVNPVVQLEPSQVKPIKSYDKSIVSLIIALLWFIAIIVAVAHKP